VEEEDRLCRVPVNSPDSICTALRQNVRHSRGETCTADSTPADGDFRVPIMELPPAIPTYRAYIYYARTDTLASWKKAFECNPLSLMWCHQRRRDRRRAKARWPRTCPTTSSALTGGCRPTPRRDFHGVVLSRGSVDGCWVSLKVRVEWAIRSNVVAFALRIRTSHSGFAFGRHIGISHSDSYVSL
jgi:hypothetical protein